MPKLRVQLTSKDLVLLLLYSAPSDASIGKTRLTKIVFLFEKEIWSQFKYDNLLPKDALPNFEAYHFGPFSSDVYHDIEFLANLGFIKVESVSDAENIVEVGEESYWWESNSSIGESEVGAGEFSEYDVSLTVRGVKYTEERLLERLSEEQKLALRRLVEACIAPTLRTLLRYVYENYPDFAAKSKIRKDILGEIR